MRKILLLVLIIISAVLLTGAFFQRHAIACELLPVLDYQRINEQMFVGEGIPEEQINTLQMLAVSASERIENIYGKPISKPRILITSNAQMAAKWGANETGSMHRMPWRSCIVIGPEGQNVDVISHEWLHAEIQHRVGFFRFLREIPTWFDEGAALTLDYRAPYLPENISLPDAEIQNVQNLKTGNKFFSGDIRRNYQAARRAVIPLIQNERFFTDLERISSGESFEAVFLEVNK